MTEEAAGFSARSLWMHSGAREKMELREDTLARFLKEFDGSAWCARKSDGLYWVGDGLGLTAFGSTWEQAVDSLSAQRRAREQTAQRMAEEDRYRRRGWIIALSAAVVILTVVVLAVWSAVK